MFICSYSRTWAELRSSACLIISSSIRYCQCRFSETQLYSILLIGWYEKMGYWAWSHDFRLIWSHRHPGPSLRVARLRLSRGRRCVSFSVACWNAAPFPERKAMKNGIFFPPCWSADETGCQRIKWGCEIAEKHSEWPIWIRPVVNQSLPPPAPNPLICPLSFPCAEDMLFCVLHWWGTSSPSGGFSYISCASICPLKSPFKTWQAPRERPW